MKVPVHELSSAEREDIVDWMSRLRPRVLPYGWMKSEEYPNAIWYKNQRLCVCVEVESHGLHGYWLHLSVSHLNHPPTYSDLKLVKELYIGRDRKAIQVFSAAGEHYNCHPNCLHLWSRLDTEILPDLRTPDGRL